MRTVILGGGYGGLRVAQALGRRLPRRDRVLLVSDRPYHQLTTRLHEVAAGTEGPAAAAVPLEPLLKPYGVTFRQGRAVALDPQRREVRLADGESLSYDHLILALGAAPEDFGLPGVREWTLPIYSLRDAVAVRERWEQGLRAAARRDGPLPAAPGDDGATTVAVVGGGLAGVEVAGEIADRLSWLTRRAGLRPGRARVVLVEALPRPLPAFPDRFARLVAGALERSGVELRLGSGIRQVEEGRIVLATGEPLAARTVVWTAGIKAHPLPGSVFPVGPRGRVRVNAYLQVEGFPEVYALGDCALARPAGADAPAAQTAQNALLQAEVVADNVVAARRGKAPRPYRKQDRGILASVGVAYGVAELDGTIWGGYGARLLKQLVERRYLWEIGGLPLALAGAGGDRLPEVQELARRLARARQSPKEGRAGSVEEKAPEGV